MIEVSTRRDIVTNETIKAIANDLDLYTRAESLGVVIQEEADTVDLPGGITLDSANGMMRFSPLAQSVLGCLLTKHATFFKPSKDMDGDKDTEVHPPTWLIAAVHELRSWPGIRHLLSLTNCPYVKTGGLLSFSGYDPSTRALYRPSVSITQLPQHPDQDDARDALGRLRELVGQFPFETSDDFAAWLAYLATCAWPS
jgi:hypothetical protein